MIPHHGARGNSTWLLFKQGRFFIQRYPTLSGAHAPTSEQQKANFTGKSLALKSPPACALYKGGFI
jgi:hypothetical protein